MTTIFDCIGTGVLSGDKAFKLYQTAQAHGFAIPAVNVTSSSSVNAVLEAAAKVKSPIIIQVSNGGAIFYCGKSINNKTPKEQAAIAGAIACAQHVRAVAKYYGVPVVLHSDHCARKLLPWFDGMLAADEAYFKTHGVPLFSSHMLDLSEESDESNISTCVKYFKRMNAINQHLEVEIGVTGGEEDGVDNSSADQSKLYTSSAQVLAVYKALSTVGPNFSVAAAFGNVHGVYKPGNVKLNPGILGEHQRFIKAKVGTKTDKPCLFVFHGGSGSTEAEIATAVSYGVVKMNVDTDLQWAYWDGIRLFYKKNQGSLQSQIGNDKDPDAPNKKYYDPRVWLRKAEESMVARVEEACRNLGNVNVLAKPMVPGKGASSKL